MPTPGSHKKVADLPTAGYSGTPLPKKLGIKEGHRLAVLREPDGFRETLGRLPPAVHVTTRAGGARKASGGNLDVILAFFSKRTEFEKRLPALMEALDVDGGLWISWPKKSSGVKTDITEDTVREVALPLGMVDNKVCAVDEIWSGLRLVYRVAERDGIRARRAN